MSIADTLDRSLVRRGILIQCSDHCCTGDAVSKLAVGELTHELFSGSACYVLAAHRLDFLAEGLAEDPCDLLEQLLDLLEQRCGLRADWQLTC